MNNGNGDALLARVRPGMYVTVRAPNGSQVTGKAFRTRTGWAVARVMGMSHIDILSSTIVRVSP